MLYYLGFFRNLLDMICQITEVNSHDTFISKHFQEILNKMLF